MLASATYCLWFLLTATFNINIGLSIIIMEVRPCVGQLKMFASYTTKEIKTRLSNNVIHDKHWAIIPVITFVLFTLCGNLKDNILGINDCFIYTLFGKTKGVIPDSVVALFT